MPVSRCVVAILCCSLAAAVKRPNIIFMLVDDLGFNDVGWNDQFGQIETPKLNQLREESVTLDQYYVYRFCSPSRSTFMSGRYPWHVGQQTGMNLNPTPGIACGIDTQYQFISQLLQERANYSTWALGKWHLGYFNKSYTPTYRGFDRYLGYYSGAEEHFTHEKTGAGPNGGHYVAYDLANNTNQKIAPCLGPVGNASATYSSYLYGNETVRMLDLHDKSKPLYIYLAWNNVHDPNEAPQNYQDKHKHIKDSNRQSLAAMMSALDDQLTAIVDKFKELGMWDDTVLVFSTDNGGNLGGSGVNYPLRGGKYTFWQGGVRGVSFVAGGKNVLPTSVRGTVWDGSVHAADWYTTFASLAGISTADSGPMAPDGVDVWEALITNSSSPRTEVILQVESNSKGNEYELPDKRYCAAVRDRDEYQHCQPPLTSPSADAASLKCGVLIQTPWKLIWGYPGWQEAWDGWISPPSEDMNASTPLRDDGPYKGTLCESSPCLFDILTDPTEHHDVATQHPEIVNKMKSRILQLLATEVTVKDSKICPTKYGSKPDPGCTAIAQQSGFWQPWRDSTEL